MEIEHYFLDELWNFGSQQVNISDECRKVLIKKADGTPVTEEVETIEETKEEIENEELSQENTQQHSPNNIEAEGAEGEEDKNENTESSQPENVDEESKESTITPEEMDDLIRRNFLM